MVCILRDTPTLKGNLSIGDHSIQFKVFGVGSIKICFLSGFLSSMDTWNDLILNFEHEEYTLLILNNRGIGESKRSQPENVYSMKDMALDVLEVWDHLGWSKCHLVGMSMGGMISLELALMAGKRLSSLSLLCTAAKSRGPAKYKAQVKEALTVPIPTLETLSFLLFSSKCSWQSDFDPRYPGIPNLQRVLDSTHVQLSANPKNMMQVFVQQTVCIVHYNLLDSLTKIASQVADIMIITGTDDVMIDPECSLELQRELPNAKAVYLKNRGHGLNMESEVEVLSEILEVVRRGEARSAMRASL